MTRADIVVAILAVLVLPYLYINYWGDGSDGETAHILVGNEELATLSLHIDQTVTIPGKLGPSTIEVHDGKIRFIDSPCSNKQCVHTGWLKHSGEFAACLPNRVSIALAGFEQRFDSINF